MQPYQGTRELTVGQATACGEATDGSKGVAASLDDLHERQHKLSKGSGR